MHIGIRISFSLFMLLCFVECTQEFEPIMGEENTYIKFLGTAGVDQAVGLKQTDEGKTAVLINSSVDDQGFGIPVIYFLDDRGNEMMKLHLADSGRYKATHLSVQNDQLWVVGHQAASEGGRQKIFVRSFDANSYQMVVSKLYESEDNDLAGYGVLQLEQGRLVVLGEIIYSNGFSEMYLFENGLDGDRLWERSFGLINNRNSLASGFFQDNRGGFVFSGVAVRSGDNRESMRWVRTNREGLPVADLFFGGNEGARVRQLLASRSGGFFLAGGVGTGLSQRMFLVSLDAFGNEQLTVRLDIGETANAIAENSRGELFLGGREQGVVQANALAVLYKLDSRGEVIWRSTYGQNNVNSIEAIYPQSDGGALLLANIAFENDRMVALMRIDQSGEF